MYEHASNLEFEEASKIRDEIKKLKSLFFHQMTKRQLVKKIL